MKITEDYTRQSSYYTRHIDRSGRLQAAYDRHLMAALQHLTPDGVELVHKREDADLVICIVGGSPGNNLDIGQDMRSFQKQCMTIGKPIVFVSPFAGISPKDPWGTFEIACATKHPPFGKPESGLEHPTVEAWIAEFKQIFLQAVEKFKQQGEKLAAT